MHVATYQMFLQTIWVHQLGINAKRMIIFFLCCWLNYRYGSGVVTSKCRNWGEFDCISYKRIQYKEHQCSSNCKRCCWKLQSITNHCCNPCWFFLWLFLCCLYNFLCCFAGKLHQTTYLYPYIYIFASIFHSPKKIMQAFSFVFCLIYLFVRFSDEVFPLVFFFMEAFAE